MIGYWVSPAQYRLVHPVTRRTQDIVFQGERTDAWEKVIRARSVHAEQELAQPRHPAEPRVIHKFNIAKTAFANDVYNDKILAGKVEPAPGLGHFFDKPTYDRTVW
jgi:hypothetical protein